MKKIWERKVYWITGTAIGLAGVVLVRLIAPELSGILGKIILIFGYVLLLAGIVIITFSTKGRAAW